MHIKELINKTKKPELYTIDSLMWNDPHISKQLLNVHLSNDIDLASRKEPSIVKTIDWILSNTEKKNMKILDLGCGPGLYTSRLAKIGHKIVGVDISAESINYAAKTAAENELDITYINESYLEADLGDSEYDLIIMIYTDFGVLSPTQQDLLLNKIYNALKPQGRFIFDVLNEAAFANQIPETSWEAEEDGGFWSADPYIHLSNSYIYSDKKIILYNHIVACESEDIKTYNFWTHFYSDQEITQKLENNNFKLCSVTDNVLPEEGVWNGKNVSFCVAEKETSKRT